MMGGLWGWGGRRAHDQLSQMSASIRPPGVFRRVPTPLPLSFLLTVGGDSTWLRP